MQDLRLLVPDPNLHGHRHKKLKGERTNFAGSSFRKFLVGQSVISRLYFRSIINCPAMSSLKLA